MIYFNNRNGSSGLTRRLIPKLISTTAIYGRWNSSLCWKGRWYPTLSKPRLSFIWLIDRNLSRATIPGYCGPGSDGNEGVLRITQSSSITGSSTLDCLMSYQDTLWGSFTALQRCSLCILQPQQNTEWKIKESKNMSKYLSFAEELSFMRNLMVTVKLIIVKENGMFIKSFEWKLEKLEIKGRIENIQTAVWLR